MTRGRVDLSLGAGLWSASCPPPLSAGSPRALPRRSHSSRRGASAAGWVPAPAVPISAPESAITMQTDAGADGTAAAVWSDGTTVRAAIKPAGTATFGAPVVIGSGQTPDVAVGPGGRVLAVWAAGDGVHGSERPAGAAGFGDLGVIAPEAGASNPRSSSSRTAAPRLKTEATGRHRRSHATGGVERVPVADRLPAGRHPVREATWRSRTRRASSFIAVTMKNGGLSQVFVAHVDGDGGGGGGTPTTSRRTRAACSRARATSTRRRTSSLTPASS